MFECFLLNHVATKLISMKLGIDIGCFADTTQVEARVRANKITLYFSFRIM